MTRRLPLMFLIALALSACGSRAQFVKRSNGALSTSLAATNAARAAFLQWDHDHQLALVAAAKTKAEGEASLARYREKRAAVVRAFTVSYSSISAAATMLPLIENGSADMAGLVALVTRAVEAAADVKRALDALTHAKESP